MVLPNISISCCISYHPIIICKEKKALAFNWDRCCHLGLYLQPILFHWFYQNIISYMAFFTKFNNWTALTWASNILHDLIGLLGSQRTKPAEMSFSSTPFNFTLTFSPHSTRVTSISSDHSWKKDKSLPRVFQNGLGNRKGTYLPVQGMLKGELSVYCWPPVWLVWNHVYDN